MVLTHTLAPRISDDSDYFELSIGTLVKPIDSMFEWYAITYIGNNFYRAARVHFHALNIFNNEYMIEYDNEVIIDKRSTVWEYIL